MKKTHQFKPCIHLCSVSMFIFVPLTTLLIHFQIPGEVQKECVYTRNGKTLIVHYRTFSFFAFRFLKKTKTRCIVRLYQGHLYPELEVPGLTYPCRESNPGFLRGKRALQKRAIQTACSLEIRNLYLSRGCSTTRPLHFFKKRKFDFSPFQVQNHYRACSLRFNIVQFYNEQVRFAKLIGGNNYVRNASLDSPFNINLLRFASISKFFNIDMFALIRNNLCSITCCHYQ